MGEPFAYIAGQKEFMSLAMNVTPAVLIPRPETELLVEEVLKICQRQDDIRICDVGTGSGAIAVSLAYYLPQSSVSAGDISSEALMVAKANARLHNVNIDFRQGDLLSPFKEEKFDLITANLPYISASEYEELNLGIKDYEPKLALWSGEDGLNHYRRFIPQVVYFLKPGGYIIMEIGWRQSVAIKALLEDFAEVGLIRDYSGRERLVKARKGIKNGN